MSRVERVLERLAWGFLLLVGLYLVGHLAVRWI